MVFVKKSLFRHKTYHRCYKDFIDGLQLRHSFFPPKRLDVKTLLQSIGSYRKSTYNSFSGHI